MNLSNSRDELSSCQCITTLYEEKKETAKLVLRILLLLQIMLENSRKDIGRFLGLGQKEKWCGTHVYKPNGEWDDVADIMMINVSESGHPVFRGSNAFETGDLQSKGKGKLSLHFNGSDEIVEVILRTVSYFRQSGQCLRSSGRNV